MPSHLIQVDMVARTAGGSTRWIHQQICQQFGSTSVSTQQIRTAGSTWWIHSQHYPAGACFLFIVFFCPGPNLDPHNIRPLPNPRFFKNSRHFFRACPVSLIRCSAYSLAGRSKPVKGKSLARSSFIRYLSHRRARSQLSKLAQRHRTACLFMRKLSCSSKQQTRSPCSY